MTGPGSSAPARDARPPAAPGSGWRKWSTIALVCLGASAALVYPPVTKYALFEPGLGGREGDVGMYVRMYQGFPLSEIARPFRYRVFTPLAARLVPMPPHALLRYFDLNGDKLVLLRFGLVNLVGLAVAGMALVALGEALGLALGEALLVAFLFYTSFPVVNFGGTPMVDTWGHAFLALGLVAMLRDQWALLAVAGLLGMLAKETTVLLVPAALLLPASAPRRLARLGALAPGLVVYAVLRFAVLPGGYGFPSDPVNSIENLVYRLGHGPYLAWIAFDGGTAFMALWPLALLGWFRLRGRPDEPLARLSWLIPPILLMPFLIGSNIGRIWFYAFPVMLPLAVLGLRRLLHLRPAGAAP
jgi:hypothetical protein